MYVRAEAVVAVVWRECCLVGVALCRRGDDVAQVGRHIPVQRDAAMEDYPELARALRGLLGGGCDARSWEQARAVQAATRASYLEWAQGHGDYATRRATARHDDGRVRDGMQEGRWAGGRWEEAAAEAQWPVCRGCARCRAWRWLECSQCGPVDAQAMAAGLRRGRSRKRRAEVAYQALQARVAEVGGRAAYHQAAMEMGWMARQHARWTQDAAFGRWRRGVRPRRVDGAAWRGKERLFMEVAQLGYDPQDLARWRGQRGGRGLPLKRAAASGGGSSAPCKARRRSASPVPMAPAWADVADAAEDAGAASDDDDGDVAGGVAAAVAVVAAGPSPAQLAQQERAAAFVLAGRARRAQGTTAARARVAGGLAAARLGAARVEGPAGPTLGAVRYAAAGDAMGSGALQGRGPKRRHEGAVAPLGSFKRRWSGTDGP